MEDKEVTMQGEGPYTATIPDAVEMSEEELNNLDESLDKLSPLLVQLAQQTKVIVAQELVNAITQRMTKAKAIEFHNRYHDAIYKRFTIHFVGFKIQLKEESKIQVPHLHVAGPGNPNFKKPPGT